MNRECTFSLGFIPVLMEALASKGLTSFILSSACPEWVVKDTGYMGCVYCPRTPAQQHKEWILLVVHWKWWHVGPIYAIVCIILKTYGVLGDCPLCFFQALLLLPQVFCFPSTAGSSLFLIAHSKFSFELSYLSQSLNAMKGFWQKHWQKLR